MGNTHESYQKGSIGGLGEREITCTSTELPHVPCLGKALVFSVPNGDEIRQPQGSYKEGR
jgi:hypothetical protein